jgi:creatinine amidohydrolase
MKPPEKSILFWHELTASEIQAWAPDAVTILPTASTEQHGPHMVTGTDTILNDLLQEGLVATPPPRGRFLILPTLTLGTSEHHVPLGGTLSIPPILYTQVLVAMVRGLFKQGHKRIFILNSHGGNAAPINTALAELAQEATEQHILLGGAGYWSFCEAAWSESVPHLKLARLGHACEIEASLLMVARPDLPLRSKPDGYPYPFFIDQGWSLSVTYPGISPEGFVGYPSEASVVKGRALLGTAIHLLGEFLADYSELPLTHDLRRPAP